MKTVMLEREVLGEDVDLSIFKDFGELIEYPVSTNEQVSERIGDADCVIVNKLKMDEEHLKDCPNLKLILEAATGVDNIDLDYCKSRGIKVNNVKGYSTPTVAQHTFAMYFYLEEHLPHYDEYVKSGKYADDRLFTHYDNVFHELSGMTYGIIGLGAIGKRVAEVATAFGCKVQYYSTSGRNHNAQYKEVSFVELLETSDIISIHAPLTEDTLHLMDKNAFHKMKKSAILLNAGRGPIISEQDLRDALDQGEIRGAGLDVLDVEPMAKNSPFYDFQDSDRLLITPHIAWASLEARQRLMHIIAGQIHEFLEK